MFASRRGGVLIAAALLMLLSSCGGGVVVDAYPREDGSALDCDALLADLPVTVGGLEARGVAQDVPAGAWGDPPVVLRCGVEMPEDFAATSRCEEVAGIGWFTENTVDGYSFTTIGRRINVQVDVPKVHDPAADVLVDLADTIDRHVPVESPCV